MTTTVAMFDDVTVGLIPATAKYVAGYADGHYANLTAMRQRFPHAFILTIDVRGTYRNGEVLDVEKYDATNEDAVGWFRAREGKTGLKKPILYTSASNVSALEHTMAAAGITRDRYYVWSAHYTFKAHICGMGCNYPKADGTQWTDKSHGRSLDESLMEDYVFDAPAPPIPPKPKNPTRVENFHTKYKLTGIADLRILDRAAANGRKDARDARNRLAYRVRRLPHDKGNSRVNKVVDTFKKSRTIDMNLLDAAVKAGRVGEVKTDRDRMQQIISELVPW